VVVIGNGFALLHGDTGSNPVLTTKIIKIMCNITPLEAIGICALIFIIYGIYIYIKSDGMGIE
jgi:hypothetical protein